MHLSINVPNKHQSTLTLPLAKYGAFGGKDKGEFSMECYSKAYEWMQEDLHKLF